jgi:hypothetical protein
MPEIGNDSVFSQTDASNGTGTMPSWLGSAAPSTIDDAGRALQGAIKREWAWRNFTLTAGGTADAKTLTYAVAPAAYYTGQIFAFIANTVNTGTCTLNVNTLGAKTLKKDVAGTMTALSAGDMPAGTRVMVAYDGTDMIWVNWQGASTAVPTANSTTEVLTGTDTTKFTTADSGAALWEKGSDIASAATISIGEGGAFDVTGTTSITDIDPATDKAGRRFILVHEGIHTLTHNASTMILLGGINIVTEVGAISEWISEGSDAVRMVNYIRPSGMAAFGKKSIKKSADQSVASTTLANDNDFTFAIAANTKYEAKLYLDTTHTSAEEFKFDITGPASPNAVSIFPLTTMISAAPPASGMVTDEPTDAFSSAINVQVGAGPTGLTIHIIAYIDNGANSGTFQFRWANSATATSRTVKARSFMTYEIVG